MAKPITDEHLAKMRRVLDAHGVVPHEEVYALLDEVERLRHVLHIEVAYARSCRKGRETATAARWRAVKRYRAAERERDEAQRVAATLRASRAEIRTRLNEALRATEADRDQLAEQVRRVRSARRDWTRSAENARAGIERAHERRDAPGAFAETARAGVYDHVGQEIDLALDTAASKPTPDSSEPRLDPDCRDGKCGSCVGGPCEHHCHQGATTDAAG